MITINRPKKPINGNESYDFELKGLSTDEKPIAVDGYAVGENSIFFEVDTGNFYYFSAGEWTLIPSSGGGGGGGGDNKVGTAIVGTAKAG